MYIRQKDGLYAGDVREFPPHIAKELIAAGRAVNPFEEMESQPEVRPVDLQEDRIAPDAKPAQKRNRR